MTGRQKIVGTLLIGLSVLLGGCAGGAGGGRPVLGLDGQHLDASDPVERGRALILTAQYGLAIDELGQVVARDPGNARALTLLAVAYGQVKRFDLADRYHARALEIDPHSAVVLNNWGYSYLVRGDDRRAADLLERAMAAGDGRPIVAANLALARNVNTIAYTPAAEVAPEQDPMRGIQLTQHVTLVRPAPRLRRIAPGVQMLLTIDTAETHAPLLLSQAPAPSVRVADDADPRFRLFQALFALIEAGTPAQAAPAPHQLAEASFGVVSDVDNFTRP